MSVHDRGGDIPWERAQDARGSCAKRSQPNSSGSVVSISVGHHSTCGSDIPVRQAIFTARYSFGTEKGRKYLNRNSNTSDKNVRATRYVLLHTIQIIEQGTFFSY